MKYLRLLRHLSLLSLTLAIVSCGQNSSAPGQEKKSDSGESAHMQKGRDWIKAQNYKAAAQEFELAALSEPANPAPRLALIDVLVLVGRYKQAVGEVEALRKINATKATEALKTVEKSMVEWISATTRSSKALNSNAPFDSPISESDRFSLDDNMELLSEVGTDQSASILRELMGSPDDKLAAASETALKTVASNDIAPTLKELLKSPVTKVKLRTAKRLWKENQDATAGSIILETLEPAVLTAAKVTSNNLLSRDNEQVMEKGIQDIAELGYPLARNFYRKSIIDAAKYQWQFTSACLIKIREAKDAEMKSDVIAMLNKGYLNDPAKIMDYMPAEPALQYLADIGDTTFVPQLRSAVGVCFRSNVQLCYRALSMLSRIEGKKWDSFVYDYPGWGEYSKLNLDINRERGDHGGSGKPVIDHSPEDADSIKRFFENIGNISGLDREGDKLRVVRIDVIDADRMKWISEITEGESDNVTYEAEVIFRGTGLPQNGWLITKVENLKPKNKRIGGSARSFLNSGEEKMNKEDFAGALEDFNKGLIWNKNKSDLYLYRGVARFHLKDYDGAIADENTAIGMEYTPDRNAFNIRGYAKCEKGDYDGAIADHNVALGRDSGDANAYHGRAVALEKKGQFEEAIADYKRAIDINPAMKEQLLPEIERAKAASLKK